MGHSGDHVLSTFPYDLLCGTSGEHALPVLARVKPERTPGQDAPTRGPSPTQATSEARAPHDQRGHPLHASRDGQEGTGRSVHRGRPRGRQGRRPGRAEPAEASGARVAPPTTAAPPPAGPAHPPPAPSPPGFLNEQLFLLLQRLQAAQGPPQAASLEPGWGGCFLPTWVSVGVPRA